MARQKILYSDQSKIFLSLYPFGCSNSLFRFSLSLTTLIILKNRFFTKKNRGILEKTICAVIQITYIYNEIDFAKIHVYLNLIRLVDIDKWNF